MHELARNNQVTLACVPGHSDIADNEASDSLARLGADTTFTGPEPSVKAPASYFKTLLKNWKTKAFNSHWKSVDSARQAKSFKYFLSLSNENDWHSDRPLPPQYTLTHN